MAREAHALPRDGTDRAVVEMLQAELGSTVVRLVRRRAAWPAYELHLADGTAKHGAVERRVGAVMQHAAMRLGVALSWHALTGRDRRQWAEPGRVLYPALAIVRPT